MVCEEGVRRVQGPQRGDADTNLVRAAQAGAPEAYCELVRAQQHRAPERRTRHLQLVPSTPSGE